MRPHRLRALRHLHRPDDDHDGQQQTSTTRRPDDAAALHHLRRPDDDRDGQQISAAAALQWPAAGGVRFST